MTKIINGPPSLMVGATISEDGEAGYAKAPAIADRRKYWRGDGTWATGAVGGDMVAENDLADLSDPRLALQNLGAPNAVGTMAALKAIIVTDLTTGYTVIVNGYYARGDCGGGRFYYDAASSATDNGGTVIQPTSGTGRWRRVYSGYIDLRWFGTYGNGTTPDHVAIQAAIDSLPANGGRIFAAAGQYLIGVKINVNKKLHMVGEGSAQQAGSVETSPTAFIKSSALNNVGFDITAQGTVLEAMSVDGQPGNGSDGVLIAANSVTLRHFGAFRAGRDGIRIGKDAGDASPINANSWVLDHVTCDRNVRRGCYVNDKTITTSDANDGVAISPRFTNNGEDGFHQQNAIDTTLISPLAEVNIGWGINFDPTAADGNGNAILLGDAEQNVAGQIRFGEYTNNIFITVAGAVPITDLSGRNVIFPLGMGSTDKMMETSINVAFSGNRRYLAFSADAVERLWIGWSDKAIAASLVAAQILASVTDINYITRAHNNGKHRFYAGASNTEIADIGVDGLEILSPTTGLILRSPNGSRYRITVDNSGVLSTASI